MNIARPADTPRAQEECARLKRYIEALKQAHQKEIDGLLAQARRQARQIAELRMEAGQAAAQGAGQGTNKAAAAAAPLAMSTTPTAIPAREEMVR